MRKKFPEFFILIILAGIGLISLFLHSVYEDMLKEAAFKWLADKFNLQQADLMSRLGEMAIPIVAAGAIGWSLYWYISNVFDRQLSEIIAPRLLVVFDDSESGGCDIRTAFGDRTRARLFRLRFTAASHRTVTNCSARLVSLRRDGREMLGGEAIRLFIAPAERLDPFLKDASDIQEYADVIAINEHNQVSVRTDYFPDSIDFGNLFMQNTTHELKIRFSSPDTASVSRAVEFFWTGNWETATMKQVA